MTGIPSAGKVHLQEEAAHPLCPWCGAVLTRLEWHKVRGGPPVGYVVVLSCSMCRRVLDAVGHSPPQAAHGA